MVPGTQPQSVKMNTINKEPQPLSRIAKGGKMIANRTRKRLMHKKLISRLI